MTRVEGETPLEFMMSQVFGLEMTEEQILAQAKRPKPKQADVLFGPIARRWHQQHPPRGVEISDDDPNLLGS